MLTFVSNPRKDNKFIQTQHKFLDIKTFSIFAAEF